MTTFQYNVAGLPGLRKNQTKRKREWNNLGGKTKRWLQLCRIFLQSGSQGGDKPGCRLEIFLYTGLGSVLLLQS